MIIDRDDIYEYPYAGEFYHTGIDETLPYDQRDEEVKIIDFTTSCDIIEASASTKQEYVDAKWTVFFPFYKETGIDVKIGQLFNGSMYGFSVNGKVIGVAPSQLGGCTAHISDKTA